MAIYMALEVVGVLTGLDEKHAHARVLSESRRHRAPRRAASN